MTARAGGHTWTPDPAPAGTRPAGGTVVLEVTHLDSDSFTRSVDRAALKWARDIGTRTYPGDWSLVNGSRYAHTTVNRRCVSSIVFRVTR